MTAKPLTQEGIIVTQPKPFTYTDFDGDTLRVRPAIAIDGTGTPVVSIVAREHAEQAGVFVPLADVEQVVAAIRTAAGQDQPADRRERYAGAILTALARDTTNGPNWGAAADAVMAVADTEQQDLRVRAEQLADLLRVAEQTSNRSEAERARAVQRAEAMERDRLRAELAQARSAALTKAAAAFREAADVIDGIDFHPNARARSLDIVTGLAVRLRRMAVEAQHTPAAEKPPTAHLRAGTNAEDCPACKGTNPDYPFLCPGPTATEEPTS